MGYLSYNGVVLLLSYLNEQLTDNIIYLVIEMFGIKDMLFLDPKWGIHNHSALLFRFPSLIRLNVFTIPIHLGNNFVRSFLIFLILFDILKAFINISIVYSILLP